MNDTHDIDPDDLSPEEITALVKKEVSDITDSILTTGDPGEKTIFIAATDGENSEAVIHGRMDTMIHLVLGALLKNLVAAGFEEDKARSMIVSKFLMLF